MKGIFNYNSFLKPICEKLTNHKYARILGCDKSFVDGGFKYPNRHDFYYKCKICGYVYFHHKPTKEDIEWLREQEKGEK